MPLPSVIAAPLKYHCDDVVGGNGSSAPDTVRLIVNAVFSVLATASVIVSIDGRTNIDKQNLHRKKGLAILQVSSMILGSLKVHKIVTRFCLNKNLE